MPEDAEESINRRSREINERADQAREEAFASKDDVAAAVRWLAAEVDRSRDTYEWWAMR